MDHIIEIVCHIYYVTILATVIIPGGGKTHPCRTVSQLSSLSQTLPLVYFIHLYFFTINNTFFKLN